MNRINRVTSILIQLQSKKIIPAKEIAQRFNISLRTWIYQCAESACPVFWKSPVRKEEIMVSDR